MTLADHEKQIRLRLARARGDAPDLCARLLVAHAAGLDSTQYILNKFKELPQALENRLEELVSRRELGEPLAYILGKKDFYESEFFVNADTLIPRPETELLVDNALNLPHGENLVFADLGCGSGCIALSVLKRRPGWRGILIDNSPNALAVAKKNCRNLGLSAEFALADIFQLPLARESCGLLLCNPPYIAKNEIQEVMPEVLAYEPHCALFSANGGLAHILAIISQAARILKVGGWLMLEHGANQGHMVQEALRGANFHEIKDLPDLAGLPRCALARKL